MQNLLRTAVAPSTLNTYVRAFRLLQSFMSSAFPGDPCLPTSIDTLAYFIAFLYHNKLASATITTYIAGIGYINQLQGHYNHAKNFIIKKLLASVKRGAYRPDARRPISLFILRRIVQAISIHADSAFQHSLLKAMYLLAFYAFLRVGEMAQSKVSAHVLQFRDIQFFRNSRFQLVCLELTFHSFKHNYNIRPIVLSLPANLLNTAFCPVHVLYQYIVRRGAADGPLFCFPGGAPITYKYFSTCLKQSLGCAGIQSDHYSSHSFRIGAASYAASVGLSDTTIQHMGRWKSVAFKRYIRMPTPYAIPT